MIFSQDIYDRYNHFRNMSIIVHGSSISYINKIIQKQSYTTKIYDKCVYYQYETNYIFDMKEYKQSNTWIDFLKQLCQSVNHYTDTLKKNIIIYNIQLIKDITMNSIKTIINNSVLTCCFLLHTHKIDSLTNSLIHQYMMFSLPYEINIDTTNDISYHKIIKLLQSKLTKQTIIELRDLSYHYYLNHKDSEQLQQMLVSQIGSNLYLPNSVKYKFIHDIAQLNHKYQYSFRKPIFFESMICSLFKHLEDYTTNL